MRAQGANWAVQSPGLIYREPSTTKAVPVRTVEEEQRSDRPQDAGALRVAAARAHLRRWLASTMRTGIALGRPTAAKRATKSPACGSPPRIWPCSFRNAALYTFATDS